MSFIHFLGLLGALACVGMMVLSILTRDDFFKSDERDGDGER